MEAIKNNLCRVCGSPDASFVLAFDNAELLRCRVCDVVWLNPMPEDAVLRNLYGSQDIEIPESAGLNMHKRHLKLMQSLAGDEEKSLVDIGAWFGGFLKAARDEGFRVLGVELNNSACEYVRRNCSIDMVNGTAGDALKRYGKGSFGMATMFHVIEHLRDPEAHLKATGELLKKNGMLFIRTPNINSALFRIFGRHWGHLALPQHVFLFSPRSLGFVLRKAGFDVVSCTTVCAPNVNEVFEAMKCFFKMAGVRRFAKGMNKTGNKAQASPRSSVGMLPGLKGFLNYITMPLMFLSGPLWRHLSRKGLGSELFVAARRRV